MRAIIRAENISKRFHVGRVFRVHHTFREAFAAAFTFPFKRRRERHKENLEVLWALKDINFEVQRGDVVGIIGNNGAGKSTLLKILSKITTPTTGRSEVNGRIGSLLEVGIGFHPDLTGRENIYLNSAILGIKRSEVARNLDEIIAFSEIGSFIDTPVKFYSSGMYLRLAFSVAIYLETEVLFMDEVLAVGDVAFQQKCLNKIHDLRNQGRTILFVSHNMRAVTNLCQKAIWLEKGRLLDYGPAAPIVNNYLGACWKATAKREWLNQEEAPGNQIVRLRSVRVRDEAGETSEAIARHCQVGIEIVYQVLRPDHVLSPKVDLLSEAGTHILTAYELNSVKHCGPRPVGLYVSTVWIPANFLSKGHLLVHLSIISHEGSPTLQCHMNNAVSFQVIDSLCSLYDLPQSGLVSPLLNWTTDFMGAAQSLQARKALHI